MSSASSFIFLGIDPGVSGGIVALRNGMILNYTSLKNLGRYCIRDWIEDIVDIAQDLGVNVYACIERVRGFIGDRNEIGHTFNKASAHTTFVLGDSYGALDMALVCSRITRKEVLPKEWQSRYGIKKQTEEKQHKFKGRIKEIAQKLYPGTKVTLPIADALLIAHHCSKLDWGV